MDFPVVVSKAIREVVKDIRALDRANADEKLEVEGVPVFYASPMLNSGVKPLGPIPKEQNLFFFQPLQLQRLINMNSDKETAKKTVIKAASLTSILTFMVKSEDDIYAFFPTPDYFGLQQ